MTIHWSDEEQRRRSELSEMNKLFRQRELFSQIAEISEAYYGASQGAQGNAWNIIVPKLGRIEIPMMRLRQKEDADRLMGDFEVTRFERLAGENVFAYTNGAALIGVAPIVSPQKTLDDLYSKIFGLNEHYSIDSSLKEIMKKYDLPYLTFRENRS